MRKFHMISSVFPAVKKDIPVTEVFPLAFVLAYFVVGILTLSKFSLTFDEGVGNLFFGQRDLYFFRTLNPEYLNFTTRLPVDLISKLDLFRSVQRNVPQGYPPLADLISAALMNLFSVRLPWMDPIDAFHLLKVLLASALLWIMYRFILPRFGHITAWMSMLFLGFFPRYWADMHFNPKDIPSLFLFACIIFVYIAWYERSDHLTGKNAILGALALGLLFGSGLAVKANAILLPAVLFLGIMPWSLQPEKWKPLLNHFKAYWLHYLLMAVVALAFYIGSWPSLYQNPIAGLSGYWGDMYELSQVGAAVSGWNIEPLWQALATMPEVMIFFLIAGLVFLLREIQTGSSAFYKILLVWLVFPILHFSLPNMRNFDGIRHFMEFVPAAAIIAGFGVARILGVLSSRHSKFVQSSLLVVVLLAFSINIADAAISYYPYLHIYYNRAFGGLSGVRDRFLQGEATDYWAVSYRDGMSWVDGNAEPNASLMIPIAGWIGDVTAKLWLRSDIRLIPKGTGLGDLLARRGVSYIMFITRESFYNDVTRYCINNLQPIHEIIVDGVPILYIYRIDHPE